MPAKLLAYCDDCGHAWIPDRSRGKLQCAECGSRNILRASLNAIIDHVREKASKQRTERVRDGICDTCGARPGCVCKWCKAAFSSYRTRIKHVRDKHPEKVKPPGGQRKERSEDVSLSPRAAADEGRIRGRAGKGPHRGDALAGRQREKSKDTEQPIHKRIGVKADKLERIVADFEKAEKRSELGEDGRPLISEEHNVEWIHLVGKVEWRTAHKIFHEVLMKDAACTLPIGYKPAE